MAVKKPVAKKAAPRTKAATTKKTTKATAGKKTTKATAGKKTAGFTAEERAAMKERVKELKSAGGEAEVLAKIAAMSEPDRSMAKRIHAIVRASAPNLTPKTWYGMPAYAKDGDVICFFQDAAKFKARYATLGFGDKAKLDEGSIWPTSFALRALSPASEKFIATLVKRAAG